MKVNLNYFKPSGKWYGEGSYDTEPKDLWEIWLEVKDKNEYGGLPGLVPEHTTEYFMILVDVPEHKHNHPHIVMPPRNPR